MAIDGNLKRCGWEIQGLEPAAAATDGNARISIKQGSNFSRSFWPKIAFFKENGSFLDENSVLTLSYDTFVSGECR